MNKVVTINLGGNAFQLEEQAYELLKAYIDEAGAALASNPDKAEILADIEQAIADKCLPRLNPAKSVILEKEIQEILRVMGPVRDSAQVAEQGAPGAKPGASEKAGTAGDFVRMVREGGRTAQEKWREKQARKAYRRQLRERMKGWPWSRNSAGLASPDIEYKPFWGALIPLVSLLSGLLTLGFVLCLLAYFLWNFGHGVLPSDFRFWSSILLAALIYALAMWPVKTLRHLCWNLAYRSPHARPWPKLVAMAVFSLLFFWVAYGLADRHVPGFHEFVSKAPSWISDFTEGFKEGYQAGGGK